MTRAALAGLALGLAMAAPQAAVFSTQEPVRCSSTPRPTTPVDADGYGVFGNVTVNARFVEGRVDQVDLVEGRPELLTAVREAMQRYTCETTETPRTLTMTFEFPNAYAKPAPKYPMFDPRNRLVEHNSMIRALYPTRVDSIFNVDQVDTRLLKLGRAVQMAKPELTPAALKHKGSWNVRMQMTVDTDGKVIHR
ncbi:hypothetical protein [Mitsuaria sp. GD03876]|uniref:hypothetical protein n=1 Tax=Mitsuaria sp. GD03876 TaxID=2975399 RepID=UPI00244BAFBE|nr:hypothetical protein [Mitsuaria sp. GD03876]MDH0867724.1 hypothetical protein [Mitsuaria sp. GD03876]